MIGKLRRAVAERGVAFLWHEARRRLLAPRVRCWPRCRERVGGQSGLEVGGPSEMFAERGLLPLYPVVGALDNCVFAARTVWAGEGDGEAESRFTPRRPPGRQLIREATALEGIADESYDFVASSHALEHSANPLAALGEWRRVLRPSGTLVLVLPHREGTFDHRRPVTPLAHLLEDRARATREDDRTHLAEILELHDRGRDPGAGTAAEFRARAERNAENRCLHHHVFDTRRVAEMVDAAGFALEAVEAWHPCHIVVLARRPGRLEPIDNRAWLAPSFRPRSPFASDRRPIVTG